MPGPTFLEGDRLVLRPVERDDAEFLQWGWTDPAVRVPLGLDQPHNRAQIEERIIEWIESDAGITLLSCLDDEPIGDVTVKNLDDTRPELAYWVAPEHQGQGYGSEAVSLLVGYVFRTFEKRGLMARTFAPNRSSRAVLEKLGFTEEGRFREHRFVGGEYVDTVVYGLLREEWPRGENITVE